MLTLQVLRTFFDWVWENAKTSRFNARPDWTCRADLMGKKTPTNRDGLRCEEIGGR